MVWLVLGMTIAVVLAAVVVGVVAIPARRSGRPLLTPRGEKAFRVADERARAARSRVAARKPGGSRGSTSAEETPAESGTTEVSRKEAKDSKGNEASVPEAAKKR